MLGNFSKKDDLLKKSVPPRRPITDKKLKSSYGHLLYHKIHARALFQEVGGPLFGSLGGYECWFHHICCCSEMFGMRLQFNLFRFLQSYWWSHHGCLSLTFLYAVGTTGTAKHLSSGCIEWWSPLHSSLITSSGQSLAFSYKKAFPLPNHLAI